MVKKQDFHPLKKIKQLVKKVGTLNLVLILMFIFFIWFNWQMLCIFRECMAIPEHMPVQWSLRRSAKLAYVDG